MCTGPDRLWDHCSDGPLGVLYTSDEFENVELACVSLASTLALWFLPPQSALPKLVSYHEPNRVTVILSSFAGPKSFE